MAEFVASNRARVTWSLPQPPWDPLDAQQTNVVWSELSRRVSSSGPALHQLQKFLGRPAANGGRPTNYFDFHPVWQEMKSAAGWLACGTLVSLREGRHDDALAGVRAMAGLAGMYREECALVHQMSRVAVANIGLDLTWEALEAEGWSEEQLSAFQRCWEEHDFLAAAELGLLGERALPLECLDLVHARDESYVRHNPKGCAERFSPCSTFKVPHTVIALHTGVASGPEFSLRWDGVKRGISAWDQDQTLRSAFQSSVVWFYQERWPRTFSLPGQITFAQGSSRIERHVVARRICFSTRTNAGRAITCR